MSDKQHLVCTSLTKHPHHLEVTNRRLIWPLLLSGPQTLSCFLDRR